MADPPRRPRSFFLAGLAAVYLAAFASLYVQIPGLYGRDGILPARRVLRLSGKGLWEQLRDLPTLLWLGPRLGLDTELGMELLCLLGVLASFGALLFEALRDCLLFALLWVLYLSLYQVGQVFLYFQWDSLLLEAGFLAALVAPLRPPGRRAAGWRAHDGLTFWLVRWLLFRLMFASGVVKLTSRCPTWWGLTALTYHYETQCIPTPGAWFAHQLPVWFQKLSVVATYVIEIAVPPLFFAPARRLRLFAFYSQVLLQLLIVLTGNYNFFNALTVVLACSLLDEEHVGRWLGRGRRRHAAAWPPSPRSLLSAALELGAHGFLLHWSIRCFGLEINWEKRLLESRVAFTYHEFTSWLRAATLPLVGLAFLSLSWEILSAAYRCACVRGCGWKLWAALQWALFSAAALGVFAVSLVPFTYIEPESNGKLWPGLHRAFGAVERFQLVNSYGLFRRMTGVGGRPEVVLEGSYDKDSWTELQFMYKPGNVSAAPAVVAPHQPRLDWQMWFAALAHHSSSPWFASFVQRLLQGKGDGGRVALPLQRPAARLRARAALQVLVHQQRRERRGARAVVAAAARAGVLPRRLAGRPRAGEPARAARAEGHGAAQALGGRVPAALAALPAPPRPALLRPRRPLDPLPRGGQRGAPARPGPPAPGGCPPTAPQGPPAGRAPRARGRRAERAAAAQGGGGEGRRPQRRPPRPQEEEIAPAAAGPRPVCRPRTDGAAPPAAGRGGPGPGRGPAPSPAGALARAAVAR
ncbi:lipase maturation factor 2 isoform 1-T1 [Chlamydotis macqueenii]